VIDPAVGEGIFLKVALESGFTKPRYVFGVDIDEHVVEQWEQINLLKSFGSRADLENHFFHQNGLLPLDEGKVLPYKKGGLREFDAVVGNPPYGGVGLSETELSDDLIAHLNEFEILGKKGGSNSTAGKQATLGDIQNPTAAQRLKSFPIEVLFVERFIQLAKPGGWIAIIIPDGILANSSLEYVRKFIAEETKVLAIVSLPRDTFKGVGTNAKTSILFLRKYTETERIDLNYRVFLGSVGEVGRKWFSEVVDSFKESYMKKDQPTSAIPDEDCSEFVVARGDKTMLELMSEKPSSRWNAVYWLPVYEANIRDLLSCKFTVARIGDFETRLTYGAIVTGKRKHEGDDYYLINQGDILFTGLDLTQTRTVAADSPWVLDRAKPAVNSIVLARSGVGGVGKNRITIVRERLKAVVDSFVDLLDVDPGRLNPFYAVVYWKTVFGRLQVERLINGVGTVNISFDEIREIKIPLLPDAIQKNVESEYTKMSAYHDNAMEAKKKGNEKEYKKNIETAEKMLKDLIARTEAVIRGERDDVI